MKINWNKRLKNKIFWLALVPAVLLLGQSVASLFGYKWDITGLGTQLTGIVNATFTVLAILGVVVDPTTSGVSDSEHALSNGQPDQPVQIVEKEGTTDGTAQGK